MINLYDVLEAADGQLFGEAAAVLFNDFCFDSRRVRRGELFIAVRTERGDGHQYIHEAITGGAMGVMCSLPPEFDTTGITIVVMRDVERTLLNWARIVLKKYGTSVIAVTGGAGKSTTKEAIASVLSTKYRVYKNPASYNGKFGLPLALGKLTAEDKLAVLEFGTDQFGEMKDLVHVTKPVVGVVTNINHNYTDRMGTVEQIAAEHQVLIEALPENGLAVLNYDDDYVRSMGTKSKAPILTMGLDQLGTSYGADFLAYNLLVARDKTGFDMVYQRERFIGKWVPLLGTHQLYNVMAALAVGVAYGVWIDDGLQALTEMQSLPGRMSPLEGKGRSLLIDDSYSSTPENTFAALDWLDRVRVPDRKGKTIFIFGDVDDLGAQAINVHREVGRRAAELADVFITEGELGAVAARAALDHGMGRDQIHITFSPQDAARVVSDSLGIEDIVLVKGGSGARMEHTSRLLLLHSTDDVFLPRSESAYDSVWTTRPSRPTWLEVDKNAIAENTRSIKATVGPDVAIMAMVKANGFGHGALAVSTTALLNGASYLGVATVNEASELREAGVVAPILCMGYTPPWAVRQAIRYNLALTLYDPDLAKMFDRVAKEMGATLTTHIKVDTGLGRLGLMPDQVTPFFRGLKNLKNLNIEGIYTHLASADSDPDYTHGQIDSFTTMVKMLSAFGYQFKYIHCSNTAGTIGYPAAHFNMVRVGLGLYGIAPSETMSLPAGCRPAMTWKTSVAQVKTLAAGSKVGYGGTYTTPTAEKIAIIPVGYADGFRRSPYHWGDVLVNGQRAPLVGRVSMDMSAINVTNIDDVKIGDEVVLIGTQGSQQITVTEVAARLRTIPYEVMSTILARVPRV